MICRATWARAVVLACVLPLLVSPAAQATSCTPLPDLTVMDVSFVGRAVESEAPYTRFAVEGQGSGPALAPEVWVLTGLPPQRWPWSLLGDSFSTSDVRAREGDRYAVGASLTDGQLETSICSSMRLRPGDEPPAELVATAPAADGLRGQEPPLNPWIFTGPALALLLALGGWALFRRRS